MRGSEEFLRDKSILKSRIRSFIAKYPEYGPAEAHKAIEEIVQGVAELDIPEGAIRFIEACRKYTISDALLSNWTKRRHVRVLKRVSRKLVYVSEADVQERVRQLKLRKGRGAETHS